LDGKSKAIAQLQRIDAELAALLVELENYGLEEDAVPAIRATLREMLGTARTLQRAIERYGLSPQKRIFLALLHDDRMRRASELNADISQDLEAGRIRTDQEALSMYLRALNQATEQTDRIFGGRKDKD
jgi:hypothetical protein